MNISKEIIRITSSYFEDTLDYFKLSKASQEYKDLLNKLTAQDMNIAQGRSDIEFQNGKALGTFWAALCLDDIIRTRQFIRGIDKAIKDKINTHKPIHILYAGTGPFATLILPFIFKYSKENINYTFLEINPLSFDILKKLITTLGLKNYKITLINEDATKYKMDSNNQPDIIISETMQNALAKEQQVPIFMNLMSQVKGSTLFIPEKIAIHIGLQKIGIPTEELNNNHYHEKLKVFEVSKEALYPIQTSDYIKGDFQFSKKQITLKYDKIKGSNQLVMFTEIQVYKEEKIEINESGLTVPIPIKDIPENHKDSISINTQYKISSSPELEYEVSIS